MNANINGERERVLTTKYTKDTKTDKDIFTMKDMKGLKNKTARAGMLRPSRDRRFRLGTVRVRRRDEQTDQNVIAYVEFLAGLVARSRRREALGPRMDANER